MLLLLQSPVRVLPLITYAPRGMGGGGGGGSNVLYISIAYYMQKGGGGEGVQIACEVAYVLNGRPLTKKSISGSVESTGPCRLKKSPRKSPILTWIHTISKMKRKLVENMREIK